MKKTYKKAPQQGGPATIAPGTMLHMQQIHHGWGSGAHTGTKKGAHPGSEHLRGTYEGIMNPQGTRLNGTDRMLGPRNLSVTSASSSSSSSSSGDEGSSSYSGGNSLPVTPRTISRTISHTISIAPSQGGGEAMILVVPNTSYATDANASASATGVSVALPSSASTVDVDLPPPTQPSLLSLSLPIPPYPSLSLPDNFALTPVPEDPSPSIAMLAASAASIKDTGTSKGGRAAWGQGIIRRAKTPREVGDKGENAEICSLDQAHPMKSDDRGEEGERNGGPNEEEKEQ